MSAWAERVSSALLAVLVSAALVLGARLWSLPVAPEVAAPGAPAYLAPDAALEVDVARLVVPQRIAVRGTDGRYALERPGTVEFDRFLWPLLAGAGAAVPAGALRAEAAEAALAARFRPGWSWAEAVLPFAAPPAEWQRLLARVAGRRSAPPAEDADGLPPVDRLLLLAGPEAAYLVWRHPAGALAFRADAGAPGAAAVRQAAARLRRALPLLPEDPEDRATLLPERVGSLRVEAGVVVPEAPRPLAIAQVAPVTYDPEGLAESFFPDLALVRKVAAGGLTVYADPEASLTLHPDGSGEFRRVPLPRAPAAPDAVRALEDVVAFASRHGGWPAGAVLADVRPLRTGTLLDAGAFGLRVAFGPHLQGWPVLQDPPWLAAEWVPSAPGGVASFRRQFQAMQVLPDFALPALAAPEVLEHADRLAPDTLPPEARRVRDVALAYRVHPGSGLVLPVWVIELGDGSRLLYEAFAAGPQPRFLGRVEGP